MRFSIYGMIRLTSIVCMAAIMTGVAVNRMVPQVNQHHWKVDFGQPWALGNNLDKFSHENLVLDLHQDKQIKILALTGKKKTALAPELPLIGETYPDFDLGIWQSVVVPVGTPRPIVDRLFVSLQKAMTATGIIEKLAASGIEPTMSQSPEEFRAFIKSQAETRQKIIKALGMKLG